MLHGSYSYAKFVDYLRINIISVLKLKEPIINHSRFAKPPS